MTDAAKSAESDQNLSPMLLKALTADKEELFQVMREQNGHVLLAALRNPALDEYHLRTLLKRRGLPEVLFSTVYARKKLLETYGVKSALVFNQETPAHIVQVLLPHLYIMDLAKLCALPGFSQDTRLLAERCIIRRLPTEPLGIKLTLARRGTATVVEALLREGLPLLVEACLDNPHLKEGAVYQFIASHGATAETISIIARNSRWKGRPNIRMVILKNPRTPAIWFTLFLPGLSPSLLRELLSVQRLTFSQRELVRQALNGKRSVP